MDNGLFRFRTSQTERHLLGIGTEIVEGFNGSFTFWYAIVEVTINQIALQF